MKTSNGKFKECVIIQNGKIQYAVELAGGKSFLTVRNGEIYFQDSMYHKDSFVFGEESHRIAKAMFVNQLQIDIQNRVMELKQIEAIFTEIGLGECLGDSIYNGQKVLSEVNKAVTDGITEILETTEQIVLKNENEFKKTAERTVKKVVADTIIETVKPIVISKDARKKLKEDST